MKLKEVTVTQITANNYIKIEAYFCSPEQSDVKIGLKITQKFLK